MTLHIAIDGIDGTGKTTMTEKLADFLKHKNYKVRTAVQPVCPEIITILQNYNLTNHEQALLFAFDRSLTDYGENWDEYDLVIWDRSILSSIAYNTDNNTPLKYIKQINKYFPEMDLYLVIQPTSEDITETPDYNDTPLDLILEKYDYIISNYKNTVKVPYQPGEPEAMFQDIVEILFEELPRCNWCGRFFTPTKHYKKYCKDECRKYGLQEQRRVNNSNYYYRYRDVMTEKQKGGLGSKNANLHGKADPNPLKELQKIRNAKRALGI